VTTSCAIVPKLRFAFALAALLLISGGTIGGFSPTHAAEPNQELLRDAQSNFKPLPTNPDSSNTQASPKMVELGRKLFFDPRISVDGTVSCMRCHQIGLYATDGLPKSRGAHDVLLPRNAPTVLNAALNFKEHWRGDFENVEDQARHALTGPGFANPDFTTAMERVKAIPGYAELFRQAFPAASDPISPDNWGTAIGAYERTLTTPSSSPGK
jgi:cytochrome c peroxidase